MNVLLFEKETGSLIIDVPVILSGMNYIPSEQECFNEAWQCAVEDKVVDPDRRDQYEFQLVRT